MQLRCLAEGYLGGMTNRTNLRVHFVHHHMRETIVILEEGKQPHSRLPKFDMFVLQQALNGRHPYIYLCRWGDEWKRLQPEEEEARAEPKNSITAYAISLASVSSFNYLGEFLSAADGNWPAVVRNIRQMWKKWEQLAWLLGREGADDQTLGVFNVAVVKVALLYVSETWVMSPRIGRTLGIFRHRVNHRLAGRQPHKILNGMWVYLPMAEAMSEAGLQEVETYITR